jgi:hypothetical protein
MARFEGKTPGAIMHTLIVEAQESGWTPDTTYRFEHIEDGAWVETLDTAGVEWPSFAEYLDILRDAVIDEDDA